MRDLSRPLNSWESACVKAKSRNQRSLASLSFYFKPFFEWSLIPSFFMKTHSDRFCLLIFDQVTLCNLVTSSQTCNPAVKWLNVWLQEDNNEFSENSLNIGWPSHRKINLILPFIKANFNWFLASKKILKGLKSQAEKQTKQLNLFRLDFKLKFGPSKAGTASWEATPITKRTPFLANADSFASSGHKTHRILRKTGRKSKGEKFCWLKCASNWFQLWLRASEIKTQL